MLKLIKKVLKFKNFYNNQQCYDNETFKEIIQILEPTILKIIQNKIHYKDDDLYQEILMKINKIIVNFKIIKHNYDAKYINLYTKKNNNYNINKVHIMNFVHIMNIIYIVIKINY